MLQPFVQTRQALTCLLSGKLAKLRELNVYWISRTRMI